MQFTVWSWLCEVGCVVCAFVLCVRFLCRTIFCSLHSPLVSKHTSRRTTTAQQELNNTNGQFSFNLVSSRTIGYDRSIPGYPRYTMTGSAREGVHNLRIEGARLEDDGDFQCQGESHPQSSPPSLHGPLHGLSSVLRGPRLSPRLRLAAANSGLVTPRLCNTLRNLC